MAKTYRAAVLHDAGDLRIERLPPAPVPAGHVAIRLRFCGICGSDLHFYYDPQMAAMGKSPHPITGLKLPITFGHEFSGEITEIGDGCPETLAVGDLVAISPVICDKTCWACEHGATNVCSKLGFIGINSAGGLSERAVLPVDAVFKLPSNITPEVGALMEPLAVGWHAVGLLQRSLTSDSATLILGGGPVGCAILLSLLAQGITNVTVSEPADARRSFCLERGARAVHNPLDPNDKTLQEATQSGFEAVFDCAGVEGTLTTAAQVVRAKGTIVNVALGSTAEIPLAVMLLKEVVLKFSMSFTNEDFLEVIDAVASGRMQPQAMITRRIALDNVVKEGFDVLHGKDNSECINLGFYGRILITTRRTISVFKEMANGRYSISARSIQSGLEAQN